MESAAARWELLPKSILPGGTPPAVKVFFKAVQQPAEQAESLKTIYVARTHRRSSGAQESLEQALAALQASRLKQASSRTRHTGRKRPRANQHASPAKKQALEVAGGTQPQSLAPVDPDANLAAKEEMIQTLQAGLGQAHQP